MHPWLEVSSTQFVLEFKPAPVHTHALVMRTPEGGMIECSVTCQESLGAPAWSMLCSWSSGFVGIKRCSVI